MIYISTNSPQFPYKEAEQLWNDNKKYFLPLDIPFNELVDGLKGNLWACVEDNQFLGFIYFNLENGKWFLSGVSRRKCHKYVTDAINRLCHLYFTNQNITEIYSQTEYKHSKLALKKAGFLQIDTNLFKRINK